MHMYSHLRLYFLGNSEIVIFAFAHASCKHSSQSYVQTVILARWLVRLHVHLWWWVIQGVKIVQVWIWFWMHNCLVHSCSHNAICVGGRWRSLVVSVWSGGWWSEVPGVLGWLSYRGVQISSWCVRSTCTVYGYSVHAIIHKLYVEYVLNLCYSAYCVLLKM